MPPDRVFLDANVLFSAAYDSTSGLARLWKIEGVTLVSSYYAAEEARRNLPPEALPRLARLLERLHLQAESRAAAQLPEGVSLPENDRPILAAALAARATHLLSGDREAFGRYYGRNIGGVVVQRPADYLRGRS